MPLIPLTIALLIPTTASSHAPIAPGEDRATRERPLVVWIDTGIAAANFRSRTQAAGTVEVHYLGEHGWSAADRVPLPLANLTRLEDTATVDGRAALALLWDDTDWQILHGEEMSDEALLALMDQARQVFVTFQVDGQWTAPAAVPLTRGARAARLYGGHSGALLVFVDDQDGRWETTADADLAATVFDGHAWSEPVVLTDDDVPEVGFDAAHDGSGWIVAFGGDRDGDATTRGDRSVHAAAIGPDGRLHRNDTLASGFSAAAAPVPVVADRGDVLEVLWIEDAVGPGLGAQVMSARWDGAWGDGAASGLSLSRLGQVRGVAYGDRTALVVREGGRFRIATPDQDGWVASGILADLSPHRVRIREWDAGIRDDVLHLVYTADVAHMGDVDPESLYHHAARLGPDVAVLRVQPRSRQARSQGIVVATAVVANRGVSTIKGLELKLEGAELIESDHPSTLAPGAHAEVRLRIRSVGAGPWVLTASHADEDVNPDDDTVEVPNPILPDFLVREVRVVDGSLRVDVRERTGLQAPPVPVRVSLQDAESTVELGIVDFDSRDPRALVIPFEAPEPPWRVVAEVNPGRTHPEGDFTNNQAATEDLDERNYRVVDVVVAGQRATVSVVVEPPGDAAVGVWLAADPLAATGSLRSGWSGAATTVQLDALGRGSATLALPAADTPFRWAVVNPGRALPETDRSDNLFRFTAASAGRPQSDLRFDGREDLCGVLGLTLANTGDAPSLGAVARILRADGLPIAEQVVPPVSAGARTVVSFEEVPPGAWSLQLRRLDRSTDVDIEVDLGDFDPQTSLDPDGDGFVSSSCGGRDCRDRDAGAYPGSATHDDACRPKVVVGPSNCGCATGTPAGGLMTLLVGVLGLLRRRGVR